MTTKLCNTESSPNKSAISEMNPSQMKLNKIFKNTEECLIFTSKSTSWKSCWYLLWWNKRYSQRRKTATKDGKLLKNSITRNANITQRSLRYWMVRNIHSQMNSLCLDTYYKHWKQLISWLIQKKIRRNANIYSKKLYLSFQGACSTRIRYINWICHCH